MAEINEGRIKNMKLKKLNCVSIEAKTLDGVHYGLIRRLFESGNIYIIDRGSFVGHKRLEFDHITLHVEFPGTRPLAPQLPAGVPAVTSEDDIVNYFGKYLFSTKVEENEIYTYGKYIVPQIQPIVDMYQQQGYGTNQATMAIGDQFSITQEHPPCLRMIDTRVSNGKLHFTVYFRSWDLWAGLPENLGGLQLLKEHMANLIGVGDGELVASSKGLHLYDYSWAAALARLGNMPENSVITREQAELGEGWMRGEDQC